ncbi:hypothetical protein LEP1GSC132_2517 [Leptospira kirschneri str. 200803703]|uniref:hypothetical protein n=1 Tax=Leptospira kirschneri TaxID=29507 RepID=UPI0002BED44A|nr:hypothetical protein [Leptospira kirschneri]EMO66427.1 hypothetical protein LEP1GSC132_2517 [Leptospira kirschneri str. 200803703]
METKEKHTSQTTQIKNKKQGQIELLLLKYNWNEIPNSSKVFRHFNLPKIEITIKNENEAHFCVKNVPYYILKDPDTIEQVLNHIDSSWIKKQNLKPFLQTIK